jgi:hypothetical protein
LSYLRRKPGILSPSHRKPRAGKYVALGFRVLRNGPLGRSGAGAGSGGMTTTQLFIGNPMTFIRLWNIKNIKDPVEVVEETSSRRRKR